VTAEELRARIVEYFSTDRDTLICALIRIGLGLVAWTRYASSLVLMRDVEPTAMLRGVAFFVLSTAFIVGYKARASATAFALLLWSFYFYWGHQLGRDAWTHHHNYALAVAVTIIALTDCGKTLSLDRWLALRRRPNEDIPQTGETWALSLLVLHLSVIYLFGALDKTSLAFVSGQRMEHYLTWYYLGFDYPRSGLLPLFCRAAAIGTLLLELALAFLLPFPRFRRYLIVPGLLLHAAFYVLLPVSTYTVTVFVCYLAYFSPDEVRRAFTSVTR